jgi:hypothetical protein
MLLSKSIGTRKETTGSELRTVLIIPPVTQGSFG